MKDMTVSVPHTQPEKWLATHPQLAYASKGTSINTPKSTRDSTELLTLFRHNSFEQHFQPGSTITLHGESADAIYLIVSGTIRCCTVDAEGHRQIFSFPKKGEFIGISDMDRWHFTAEAVDHVIVRSIPRTTLEQELATNISLRQEMRAHMRGLLARRERQLLTLVSTKGPERLYRFLEEFAQTRSGTGHIVLPMCRRDIGDHIGLSMESVCRAFGNLKRKGLIDLKSHEKYKIMSKAQRDAKPDSLPADA
ncbi:MAG: Crp/Fnr family transcriptional regulator [Roseovarius sp.]|nr:Crp/Fnr family transcriptional regulator [Roseovarius sp.]